MTSFSIALIVIILLLIIILLIFLIINLNKKKSNIKNQEISENDMEVPMPNVYTLFLPSKIENIANSELTQIAKKIFNPFKYIDYKNMNLDELDKKEWHSWQISILLLMYKRGEEFFIPEQEKYFHSIFLNSNENDMKSLMTAIIKKYNNYVEHNKSKDELSKDYIWSNRDASIIFYFLANYKNYKK